MQNLDSKPIEGILLVDKPLSWTSFDIVAKLRKITNVRKIGHAGTLDPLATGLLIILIGKKYTRQQDKLMKQDKEYLVTIRFGQTSPTYDLEGDLQETATPAQLAKLDQEKILGVIQNFVGQIEQQVPIYSAVKVQGRKLYQLAREKTEVAKLPSRKVQIKKIELQSFHQLEYPEATLLVSCTSGTYIRSLAHDIGQELGVGGVVTVLRRTKIGTYSVLDAISVKDFSSPLISQSLIADIA